jgi:transposase-like protein
MAYYIKHPRTHPAITCYAICLYFNSRSYRFAAKSLEPIIKRSFVTLWKWVQKYSNCTDRFRIDRRVVKEIFADETLIPIDGQDYWLWIAHELRLNLCLMMHICQKKEPFLSATAFSSNCVIDMGGSPFSQTALAGI